MSKHKRDEISENERVRIMILLYLLQSSSSLFGLHPSSLMLKCDKNSTFFYAFEENTRKQVTRVNNIVLDGWAGKEQPPTTAPHT